MFGILCVCFGLIPLINAVPEFEDGDLRLLGGSTENEGTVLIYHNGRWGSICDRGWDIRDGNVACHQLGFQRALQTLRYSPFGPGRTLRWLTGLRCRGRESRLDQCYPRQWGIERDQRYCSGYSRSAAVVCLPHSTTTSTTTPSTTTTTPSTTTTKPTTTTTAKQRTQSTKKSTIPSVGLAVDNIIPTRRAIDAIEHNRDKEEENEEETKTVVERYSNNTIIFDDKDRDDIDNDDQDYESDEENAEDTNENAIQSTAGSRSQPRRSHLQFDAEWSETRRTRDRDVITTASPLKESTSTSRPTTTKEHSRAAAPAPVGPNRYDEEVYSISLPSRRWIKDPLLKCWVLLTYREEILIAKPGQRPSRITKEEYYKKRRAEIIKQRGEENIPNEINRSLLNDASGSRTGNTGNNQIVDRPRVPTTTTKRPTTTKTPTTTTTTTSKPTTTTTQPTTTTPKPTTTTTQPTTTTTPKPTTKKPTTTTTTTTTPKPTTTTTKRTTTTTTEAAAPAPVSAYENEVFSVELVTGKWIKDEELNMWVMLSRSGGVSVAKPGQRARKIDEDDYYQMRREAIIKARDRLKADDPTPGQVPAPSRQLSFEGGGGTIRSRNEDASSSSNIVISSDLNITREEARSNHHRNRHWHGSKKIETRLAGSRSNRGRLEVRLKGREEWGVVCGDHWTIKEAMVVCRDMNAGYGQQAIKRAVFGGSNMKKYFSRVRCKGTEKRLEDCQWEDHEMSIQCMSSDSVAGVICASALPDLEPSIYMLETSSFLQDRHLYYLQCAMEEKCLAPSAYEAQRSRGWRAHTRRLLRFSSVVKNIGTADFRPMLNRDEWEWHACHMHYHSMDVFAHYDILDTNGNRVAEGLKASFCLEDSACDRGIRPKYSCQNYGQQGISVGCSDNYMADIDCQWVDITDLKQGKYVFKVEINPNLIVAEISYDNNVVICDLNYTGYYARIYNCKHEGLL